MRNPQMAITNMASRTKFCGSVVSYAVLYIKTHINWRISTKEMISIFTIVNIPFLYNNIPTAPAYEVYISQLIRYPRACHSYHDFVDRE